MANQQVDGELLKNGSVTAEKLEGGILVSPGPDTVGATQIIAAQAAAIRTKIGVDAAQASASLSAATTLNVTGAAADFVTVNGSATVTAITLAQGKEAVLRFTDVCTLTHAVTLTLPGSANYVTAAGDALIFRGLSAGVVCVGMLRTGGPPRMNRFYESSPLAITSGGSISNTHGLGVAPTLCQGYLVNVTGEAGYTTGQIVQVPLGDSSANRGVSAVLSSTAVVVRYGSDASAFQIPHATTGATTAITNANWNLIVRAWAA
jgi:hypothetical protein